MKPWAVFAVVPVKIPGGGVLRPQFASTLDIGIGEQSSSSSLSSSTRAPWRPTSLLPPAGNSRRRSGARASVPPNSERTRALGGHLSEPAASLGRAATMSAGLELEPENVPSGPPHAEPPFVDFVGGVFAGAAKGRVNRASPSGEIPADTGSPEFCDPPHLCRAL